MKPSWKRQAQQPLQEPTSSEDEAVGYLHTYVPKHPLRLLYIDGLSGGKTTNGTLDTQDYLLLNRTTEDMGGPMGGEMERAKGLCSLAASVWEGKIDGIIRMEGGFEIILCDFESHLDRRDVIAVTSNGERGRGPMGGWQYIKAITSRYHGIGGNRVEVDYNAFTTVFAHDDTKGLWDNNVQSDQRMPRLTNIPPTTLAALRDSLTSLVQHKDWTAPVGPNWQTHADAIVARYSAPLHHITTHARFRTHKPSLAAYLTSLLHPFIDPLSRNASLETARCAAHTLPVLGTPIPPVAPAPLAHRALHAVATRVCDTLLTALSIAAAPTPHSSFSDVYAAHGVELVEELVGWLGWTSWKECGGCGDEEVCFVPIWPMGSVEDHARPRCRGEGDVAGRMGYWGVRRGPPGDGKGGLPGGREKGRKKGWFV